MQNRHGACDGEACWRVRWLAQSHLGSRMKPCSLHSCCQNFVSRDFIHRHHVEPRVNLHLTREGSCPLPLECVDDHETHTSFDVFGEKEIVNCQIRGQASLGSRCWMKNHPMDFYFPVRDDKKTRPEKSWPEMWKVWIHHVTKIRCTNMFSMKIPGKTWHLTKVRNKKEVINEARKGLKVHFASLMDSCHLEKSELERQFQKNKRSSCAPR